MSGATGSERTNPGRFLWGLLVWALLLTSCQHDPERVILPTRFVAPSPTPSLIATMVRITATPTITFTSTIPWTPSHTPTQTNTPSARPTRPPMATRTPMVTPASLGDATVTGVLGVNLRIGPSQDFEPPLRLLEPGTLLFLTAISPNADWYQVTTLSGERGWVYGELITIHRDNLSLPVAYGPPPTVTPPPPAAIVYPVAPVIPNPGGTSYYPISERVRQIYQQGRQIGNQPQVFSKVGDSITASQPFMIGFGVGAYFLGAYGYLQGAVDFFAGSYTRSSLAAYIGITAAGIMDPSWATDPQCQAGETPLACEYRLNRPSIAIIMLGSKDVQLYRADEFQGYMSSIIDYTISCGVIPVLTTFPNDPGYYQNESEAFNAVIRSLAAQYQIPLIDLRPAALALPGYGVGPDRFHLSQRGDSYIDLNNNEQQLYGLTLRNLLTMQMLDSLWRGVPMN